MHFDLSAEQIEILASLRTLLSRSAGADRVRSLGGDAPSYDHALDDALETSGFAGLAVEAGAGPLDAALVVEEVARQLGVVALGARALVATGLGLADLARPIAVVSAAHRGPARFAADAATLLVVGDDEVRVVDLEAGTVHKARSRFGYPFGDVESSDRPATRVAECDSATARAWWRTALAIEMAGTMSAALDLTVAYVTDRKQFGRAIGSFQALQHRLAELTVLVDGARYLALEAAYHGAPPAMAAAALTHASNTARRVPGELHQMTGAMGFATEYPLHLWTMRLPALLAEARSLPSTEAELVALRWQGT